MFVLLIALAVVLVVIVGVAVGVWLRTVRLWRLAQSSRLASSADRIASRNNALAGTDRSLPAPSSPPDPEQGNS